MKKNLSPFLLLCIVLFACKKKDENIVKQASGSLAENQIEETPYYYYYNGAKQYLHLNPDYFFVSYKSNNDISPSISSSSVRTFERKENLSAKMKKQFNSSSDYSWAEYKLADHKSDSEYIALLENMKQKENVELIAPYFKDNSGKKIGLSNFFYVKLKSQNDIELLKIISDKYSVNIIEQNKFMPLWYTLSCSKKSPYNAMQLANIYYESGQFQHAEPDMMIDNLLQCASDPLWSNQWALLNTGQNSGTIGLDIKACGAWGMTKGENIKVAVIDDGIEMTHEDLVGNIYSSSYDVPSNSSPSQVRGNHGTQCAGIIGANDNSIGITGVAPNCQLMSVSCDLSAVNTTVAAGLANAISWAWTNGADVISNSWNMHSVSSTLLSDAISNALSLGRGGKGCVVVFSSGNQTGSQGSEIGFPANSNPDILVVGAMSQCGQRISFTSCQSQAWASKYGTAIDVVAPGQKIATTDRTGSAGDVSGNYNSAFYGTSSSCPIVAGVAALILSVNPNLTALEVRNVIESTSEKTGSYSYTNITGRPNGTWNQEMGYGLVNAYTALSLVALPINNEYTGAITLTPSTNSTCDQQTTVRFINSTMPTSLYEPNWGLPNGWYPGTLGDVWYKFTATSNTHAINVSNPPSGYEKVMELYSLVNNNFKLIDAYSWESNYSVSGLEIGSVYYVRLVLLGQSTLSNNVSVNICVTSPAIQSPTVRLLSFVRPGEGVLPNIYDGTSFNISYQLPQNVPQTDLSLDWRIVGGNPAVVDGLFLYPYGATRINNGTYELNNIQGRRIQIGVDPKSPLYSEVPFWSCQIQVRFKQISTNIYLTGWIGDGISYYTEL